MLCQMNYKQQRYGQDDSLSIIFYMQTVHKSLENFRELFCLESNVKGYLRWISQVLKALGRNQCPGCPLQCLIRMHNDVTWFFSQCCLSYAMQPHRRTDTIRRNRFDYTLGNQICAELFLELPAQTPPKGTRFFAWNNSLCGTDQYVLVV